MKGWQTVTLFAPVGEGHEALVLHGVHWQEESAASGPVARLFTPLYGAHWEELRDAAALPGALLAVEGEHQSSDGEPCWVLQHAVRHNMGPSALHHWEFVFV